LVTMRASVMHLLTLRVKMSVYLLITYLLVSYQLTSRPTTYT